MTKLTNMCATARRQTARKHRTEANVIKLELDKVTGFSAEFIALKARLVFHTAQAKLWESAAQQAEARGFVRI
jgi:hypothetical protein